METSLAWPKIESQGSALYTKLKFEIYLRR